MTKKQIINRESKTQIIRMAECWASDTGDIQAVYVNKATKQYNYCDLNLNVGNNWIRIGLAYPTGYMKLI